MKKHWLPRFPIVFVLAIASIFLSCDNEPMEEEKNPFVGTWEDRDDEVIERFIFTKDLNVTRTVQAVSPEWG